MTDRGLLAHRIFPFLCALVLCVLAARIDAQQNLRVKGPTSVAIQVKNSRTSGQYGLLQTVSPLGLWCQAVIRNSNGLNVVPAQEIFFRHEGHKIATHLEEGGTNSSLIRESVNAFDAGVWTCSVHTKTHGNATGDITVYLRPVVLSNSSLRIDDRDSSSGNHFDASGVTIVKGNDAQLECPVFGYPRPTIRWTKNGGELEAPRMFVKDGVLHIKNVSYTDDAVYICTATNKFPERGVNKLFDILVERRLRVKSEYAWILPLAIIIVVVTLLVVIIVFCEFRKRKNEQKLLETDDE